MLFFYLVLSMKHLSTSLMHTAWTEDEKRQLDELIAHVEAYEGDNFIEDVCQFLYRLINIDNILVGYQQGRKVQTVYFQRHGRKEPNFTYHPAGTPCSQVLGQDLYYVPYGLQTIYPDIALLQQLQVESYLGMPLFDQQDQGLGLIVLLHQHLIERGGFVEALLNVIAPRLEQELQLLLRPADHYQSN